MTKLKIAIAGLLALASATAQAGCVVIDDKGTVLCSAEPEVIIKDEAANRVLIPAYAIICDGKLETKESENGQAN